MTPKPSSSSFFECSIPTSLNDYDNTSVPIPTSLNDYDNASVPDSVAIRRQEQSRKGFEVDPRFDCRAAISHCDRPLDASGTRSVGSDADADVSCRQPCVSVIGVSFSGSYEDTSPSSPSSPSPRHDNVNANSSPAVKWGTEKPSEPGNGSTCKFSPKQDPLTPNSITKCSSVCTGTISHGHSTPAKRRGAENADSRPDPLGIASPTPADRGFRLMRFESGRVRRFFDPFPKTPARPDDVPRRKLSFVSMAGSAGAESSDTESSTVPDGYSRVVSSTPPIHAQASSVDPCVDDLTVCTPEPAPAGTAAADDGGLTPRRRRRVRLLAAVASPRIRDSLKNTGRRIRRLRLRRRERPSGWLIPADHPVKVGWDVCTVLLSMISAYLTHTSIRDRHYDKDHFLIRFCELWFFVDICLNFFTQHRSGRRVLFSVQSVWARYLTTWFIIDAISFLPWEKVWVKPIVEMQKRRNIVQKTMRRSKVVFKVTRMLRGRHVRWFQHVTRHTKHAGVGSRRLLNMMIKYIPKYFVFLKNMRGVLAVRTLRQIHWCRKVMKNLCRRNGIEQEDEDEFELIEDEDGVEDDDFDEHIVRHEELLKLGLFDAEPHYRLKQD